MQQPLLAGARPLRGGHSAGVFVVIASLLALVCSAWMMLSGNLRSPAALYQIGDQEYLPMPGGSVEDTAVEVQKILNDESILLKKIDKRARKNHPVEVDIEAGQIGPRGRPGPKGYFGPKGFPGPRGDRGPRGDEGPMGDTGPTGIKGVKGQDGEQGPHGDKGDQGLTGPPGPKGRRGREGRRGKEGTLGKNGAPGAFGTNGEMGFPGPRGTEIGLRGPPGPPGSPGPPGRDGDPGQDGPKGPIGPTGGDGQKGGNGIRGPEGPPGDSLCSVASTVGKSMCCGNQIGGGTMINNNLRYFDVDTSECKFSAEPQYFASIKDGPSTVESVNIANPDGVAADTMSPSKVRVYVTTSNAFSKVNFNSWRIQWCGLGEVDGEPQSFQMCCGQSSNSWSNAGGGTIYKSISTAGCGWGNGGYSDLDGPFYFASVSDSTCLSELRGGGKCASKASGIGSINSPNAGAFNLRVQAMGGESQLSTSTAASNQWKVTWCGVKKFYAQPSEKVAGYPCTSLRILRPNGSNSVQTNSGKLCCAASSAGGWMDARDSKSIEKTVDISGCGFTSVKYVLTTLRGDNTGVIKDHAKGGNAFMMDGATKFKVYVNTDNRLKFFNTQAQHWRVNYCVAGI